MDRKRLFTILSYLVIGIFLVNYVAVKFHWYYSIWYFDMPMHFLGGFWVGLALLWFFYDKELFSHPNLKLIFQIILGILIVGVAWEIFEFIFNNYIGRQPFNSLDTASDVFFDLSGGSSAVLYVLNSIMRTEESAVELH